MAIEGVYSGLGAVQAAERRGLPETVYDDDGSMSESKNPPTEPPSDVFEEEPKSRTGRFHVPHRGGSRIEVGEPIKVGGARPWMCAVKLVGQKRDDSDGPEPTQTLLVRTGRGHTPEEAQREAINNLTLVYGSPVAPPPSTTIDVKESQRPAPAPPPRPSFIDMLKGVFTKK